MYLAGQEGYRERIAGVLESAEIDEDRKRNLILAIVFGVAHNYGICLANQLVVDMNLNNVGIRPIHEGGPDDPSVAIAIAG